jgi:[acyl-carrier-protein] S-malonyltransferase
MEKPGILACAAGSNSKSSIVYRVVVAMQSLPILSRAMLAERYVQHHVRRLMKTAFIFPGQGSQYAGMGKSLAEQFPIARQVFDEADDALGFSLSTLCFEGPDEPLRLTENTQPALLSVSTAACRVLAESGYKPDYVAGHSLGEYSALVAGGSLQFTDAVRLVRKRGRYMQEAVPAGVGAMAALLKLPEGKLDSILAEAAHGEVVSAANLNSPDQVVIAGHTGAVQRAVELAKIAGARRAVMLPVSAPFHCALMKPAQERLAPELNATQFHDLVVPLVNNWRASAIHTGEEARQGLFEQVPNPVLWSDSIRRLASQGVTRFIEVGPGAVLTGLLRNIDPDLQGLKFGEAEDLEKLNAAVT